MVKLKDVAEKAKVSLATASLALNDSTLVGEKTKQKVKEWAKKLEYYPNIYAQKLARQKSYNISIMINSDYFFYSSKLYYLRIISGIIREAEKTEYTISFVLFSENEKDKNIIQINKLNTTNVDGILVLDIISRDTLDLLRNCKNIPIVLIDNHKGYDDMFGVDNDDFGGAYKAVEYFIKNGHTKIGYIGTPDLHPLGFQGWSGFKKALSDYNLKEECIYKKCNFDIKSGKKAMSFILNNYNKSNLPTAFFCLDDYIAIGAIEELKIKGFRVPEDISIIGMDDMELSSEIEPPLSTIRIRMEDMGVIGVKKLISIINKNYDGELKTIIKNKLIIRSTCTKIK
ncbi:MAG: LacI family transcriptional regulator [Cyanobacteria bacterium]|nr:LacI family transcriptional regulator [Cyanobacteriota bacterium]